MKPCRGGIEIRRRFTTTLRVYGKPPNGLVNVKSLQDEQHHKSAREWVEGFEVDDIPKKSCEITYARSSGPGGQHVNKTSSKAVVRLPLSSALGSWLPRYVLSELQASPHYLPNPPSLLITSQATRSAPENLQKAFVLMHKTIKEAAIRPIIGETSEEQKEKVGELVEKEKAKRRMLKEKQKSNIAARRGEW